MTGVRGRKSRPASSAKIQTSDKLSREMGYFIDRRKRRARGWEWSRIGNRGVTGGRKDGGGEGGTGDRRERTEVGCGEGERRGVTVSGVRAASCLAASEKPVSDKHGLRHATSSTRGGGSWLSSIPEVSMLEYYVTASAFSRLNNSKWRWDFAHVYVCVRVCHDASFSSGDYLADFFIESRHF